MKFSDTTLPSNKKFGLFFAFIFALVFGYFFHIQLHIYAWVFGCLSISFFTIALTKPRWLIFLNKLWMRFGILLGTLISPIVLGLIFFGLFTPISLFMRALKRDELRLKQKSGSSHWKLRETKTYAPDTFKNQF